MERYGIQVNNRAGNVVLHSDFSTYVFKGKVYADSTARVIGAGGNYKAYDTAILDVGYTSVYTLTGPVSELDDLIPFVKLGVSTQRVAPKVFNKEVSGSTVTYTIGITHDFPQPPIIYYFVPRRNLPGNNLDYGLEVYDEQGSINFSTEYKPLRVDGVVKVTPPSGQIHDTIGGSVRVHPKFGALINTPYSTHGGDILYSWDSLAFGAGRETKTWRVASERCKAKVLGKCVLKQKKHVDHLLTAYSGFRSCISAYGSHRTRISYIGDFGGIYQTSKDHGWDYTGILGGVLNAMSDAVAAIKTIVHTGNVIGALQTLIQGKLGEGNVKVPAVTLPARSTTENLLMYSRASYYD